MKYIILLIILFFMTFPIMINSTNQDNIHNIINANNANYFSITKTQGAFLSFNIPLITTVSGAENIVLSIFLEDSKNTGEISEFFIYPVDRISKQVGTTSLVIKTKTQKGSFVDFVLPPKFFEGIKNPLGFIIQSNQDSYFVFKGPDEIGTTHDPRLTVEEGRTNVAEKPFDITPKLKSEFEKQLQIDTIERFARTAATNSESKWYEKPYFTIPLGFILCILSSVAYNILKKIFPSL